MQLLNACIMRIRSGAVLVTIWMLLIFVQSISAQKPHILESRDTEYKTAMELFEKQKYGAAQKHFQKAIASYEGYDSEWKTNAEYYAALCAIELFNEDADYLILEFIRNHPESPKTKLAIFELARFEYQKNNYRRAVRYFEQADRMVLSQEQLAEYYFKSGYSYFMTGEWTRPALHSSR
jgi:TolA-binding protein